MAAPVDRILRLPNWVKLSVLFVIMGLLFMGFYFTIYKSQLEDLRRGEERLDAKRGELHKNKVIADNLPIFREEVKMLKKKLEDALNQLPNEKEIPQLIKNIEILAAKVDLTVFYVKLMPEIPRGFYSDVPLDIKVKGGFHNTVIFFDEIGRFSRIINISKIKMGDVEVSKDERVTVTTSCLATTFRFLQREGGG